MKIGRTFQMLVAVAVCAVLGYLLVTMPGRVVEQYETAAAFGEVWGYVYLALVGLGLALMLGAAGYVTWALWRNTRRVRGKRERDRRSIREMSRTERREAIDEHVAEARRIAADADAGESAGDDAELRAVIEQDLDEVESKLTEQTLQIVAFGTISSGKSSVLNALAGRDVFETDVKGGTTVRTRQIEWANHDRVELVDTPGLGEVEGGQRTQLARSAARNADLVVFVIDGPLKDFEHRTLEVLHEMEKRIVVCLNKGDWYTAADREALLSQIRTQLTAVAEPEDLVAVRAKPMSRTRIRVLPDGAEQEETVETPPDIAPLAERMVRILRREGQDLLLASLLLRSRGLVSEAKERVRDMLDRRARRIIERHTWRAAGVAAVNPVPVVDVMAGLGFAAAMVLELAKVYRQPIDIDTAKQLIHELFKSLSATLGVTAVTPAVSGMIASTMKTVPGIGTISGGLLQGLTQAVVMKWIGRVMIVYLRNEMTAPSGSLSDEAAKQWKQLTSRSELANLAMTGVKRLRQARRDREVMPDESAKEPRP